LGAACAKPKRFVTGAQPDLETPDRVAAGF
jgi:hypothetical protein